VQVRACDSESATCLLSRDDDRSILKAAKTNTAKHAALDSQWRILSLLGPNPDFPGPRPLARHPLDAETVAIEITFLPGDHPEFHDESSLGVFGEIIARLHRVTKGLNLPGAITWDFNRVALHFGDPRLIRLLSSRDAKVAPEALKCFGPRFEAYLMSQQWTGLIHSDSHRHNVVIHEGRGSLIDFGEAGLGPLFWDLGVAVADSVVDAPERAIASRRTLVDGYLSGLPDAAEAVERDLAVFERCALSRS
jgi:Ser/Thr protein kinase RdoA (MazF antagonist)